MVHIKKKKKNRKRWPVQSTLPSLDSLGAGRFLDSSKIFFLTSTHQCSIANWETCILCLICLNCTSHMPGNSTGGGILPAFLHVSLMPQKERSLEIEIFDTSLLSCIPDTRVCCSVMPDSATPWNAARQAPLSFTVSQSLLKLECILLNDALPNLMMAVVLPLRRVWLFKPCGL